MGKGVLRYIINRLREMNHEIDFKVHNYTSREELRRIVVYKFLEEEPGLVSCFLPAKKAYSQPVHEGLAYE